MNRLKAGGVVDLFVPVTPGSPAKKIGLSCEGIPVVRRSELALLLRRALAPVAKALKLAIPLTAQIVDSEQEIWCDELIATPMAPLPPITEW